MHTQARWDGNRANAGQRGYGQAWRVIRSRILERDRHRCTSCGEPAEQVDHIKPKHKGGGDDDANLTSQCRRCHDTKTGREGRLAR